MKCILCNNEFESFIDLRRHNDTVHSGGGYKCIACYTFHARQDALIKHQRLDHPHLALQKILRAQWSITESAKSTLLSCIHCLRTNSRCDEGDPCSRCNDRGLKCSLWWWGSPQGMSVRWRAKHDELIAQISRMPSVAENPQSEDDLIDDSSPMLSVAKNSQSDDELVGQLSRILYVIEISQSEDEVVDDSPALFSARTSRALWRRDSVEALRAARTRRARGSSCSSAASSSSCASIRTRRPRRRKRRTRKARRSHSLTPETDSDNCEYPSYAPKGGKHESSTHAKLLTWLCVPPTRSVLHVDTGQPILTLRECPDCRRIKRYASQNDASKHMKKVHYCADYSIVRMSSCSVLIYGERGQTLTAHLSSGNSDLRDNSSIVIHKDSTSLPEADLLTSSGTTNSPSGPRIVPSPSACTSWYSRLHQSLSRFCRPKVSPGFKRVEWQCECGRSFWGDFRSRDRMTQLDTSNLNFALAAGYVTRPGPAVSANQGSNASSSFNLSPSSTLSPSNSVRPSASQQPSQLHNTTSSMANANGSHMSLTKPVFFEICVNSSRSVTTLGEVILVDGMGQLLVSTDRELFEHVKRQYNELRQKGFFAWLYRPSDIHYVRFGTQPAVGHFDIYQRPDALPPEEEVKNQHYHYYECPLDALPPMPAQTFYQYFRGGHAANCADRSALFWNRLPKKLGKSMRTPIAADRIEFGWGVHIIERPNKMLLSILVAVIILISLATSIVYDIVAKSNESGFAIGQWMLGVLSATLAAIYFHLAEA